MLTVAMVQVGDYLGMGRRYVEKLVDGVRRHMPKGVEYRLACVSDGSSELPDSVAGIGAPYVNGWWAKLALFMPGAFPAGERCLYFDLDVLPVGDLSDLAGYRGKFAMMADPVFPDRLNSSIMAWEAGTLNHIWELWDQGGRPQFDKRGDQAWIETMQPGADRWQTMLPGQVVSFKADCWLQGRIPRDARAVVFHGAPRPHETTAGYIQDIWNRPLLERTA